MPPLLWGMLPIFWGAPSCGIDGCRPTGLGCPLSCPFAGLFNPIMDDGFAVLAVAMASRIVTLFQNQFSQCKAIFLSYLGCNFFVKIFLKYEGNWSRFFFLKNVLCPRSDLLKRRAKRMNIVYIQDNSPKKGESRIHMNK